MVFVFGNSVYYICTSGGPSHIYTMIYDFQKGVGYKNIEHQNP